MCCKFIANKVYVQEKKFNVKLFIDKQVVEN